MSESLEYPKLTCSGLWRWAQGVPQANPKDIERAFREILADLNTSVVAITPYMEEPEYSRWLESLRNCRFRLDTEYLRMRLEDRLNGTNKAFERYGARGYREMAMSGGW